MCKIRRLTSPSGETARSVGPGTAAVVTGWKDVPNAGDEVLSGSESDIKRAIANRIRKAAIEATLGDVESINENLRVEREAREGGDQAQPADGQPEGKKALRVLIKADVSGTVEAVEGALQGIGNHLAGVKIVASGVGPVTESDVMRAKASEGKNRHAYASCADFAPSSLYRRLLREHPSLRASSSGRAASSCYRVQHHLQAHG